MNTDLASAAKSALCGGHDVYASLKSLVLWEDQRRTLAVVVSLALLLFTMHKFDLGILSTVGLGVVLSIALSGVAKLLSVQIPNAEAVKTTAHREASTLAGALATMVADAAGVIADLGQWENPQKTGVALVFAALATVLAYVVSDFVFVCVVVALAFGVTPAYLRNRAAVDNFASSAVSHARDGVQRVLAKAKTRASAARPKTL